MKQNGNECPTSSQCSLDELSVMVVGTWRSMSNQCTNLFMNTVTRPRCLSWHHLSLDVSSMISDRCSTPVPVQSG